MAELDVCPVEELPPGEVKIVHAGEISVGVYNLDGELVAAQRVHALRGGRGRLEMPVVARVAVVIQDVLAVEVVHRPTVSVRRRCA